jgi:hypothetical protein
LKRDVKPTYTGVNAGAARKQAALKCLYLVTRSIDATDVSGVASKNESSLKQIAKDFGISWSRLSNWMCQADVEDGIPPT